jgi:hypothetical protein
MSVKAKSKGHGMSVFDLSTWDEFYECVQTHLIRYDFIYRGQRAADWRLESGLDRMVRRYPPKDLGTAVEEYLETFKQATAGRRGPNPRRIETTDEWWALGQHYGLATPLLDWSVSPFVAAFFAFSQEETDGDARAVYALSVKAVNDRMAQLAKSMGLASAYENGISFVRLVSDENSRLINQGGLFTRSPIGSDIESWVRANYASRQRNVLVKITIPNSAREECLISLTGMNISYLSLFPDLEGASLHSKLAFQIEEYQHSPLGWAAVLAPEGTPRA